LYFYFFIGQQFLAGRAMNSTPAAIPVRWQQQGFGQTCFEKQRQHSVHRNCCYMMRTDNFFAAHNIGYCVRPLAIEQRFHFLPG
jgi:hypothetical protein